ncbi:MAG: type II toxin-antitoxin system Phd/YefM family antitoxin [Candidatus Nanopelagicaceae bacterium]|nr:type II toxin-antitoxin system Phd/YefM family antitoxin [Candidatus Nanopelagicaceae bacterium]
MVITASEARAQLFPLIEQVNNDSTPVIITSKKGNAVLVSESEWESILETVYLLRTPTNRERLARSQAEVLASNLYEYELPITKASQGKKVSRSVKKIASARKAPKAKKKMAAVKVVKRAKKKTSA